MVIRGCGRIEVNGEAEHRGLHEIYFLNGVLHSSVWLLGLVKAEVFQVLCLLDESTQTPYPLSDGRRPKWALHMSTAI